MTDEEFNQRMHKLAERHDALNRPIERRAKELEAIVAQLASVNTKLEALAAKTR